MFALECFVIFRSFFRSEKEREKDRRRKNLKNCWESRVLWSIRLIYEFYHRQKGGGLVETRNRPTLQNGFLVFITVNWNAIRWFLSKSDHSSSSRMLTIDSRKSLSWVLSASTIWLVSFALQASFKSIYTSSESPFFSLLNAIFKCIWLFFFQFFLCATMFMVEVSCCTPPVKLDLLRSIDNLHTARLWLIR